MTEVKQLNTL